jgi:hypothetical protein
MGRAVKYKPTKPDHKVCVHCRNERPLVDFYRNKTTKDGLESWCKPCKRVLGRGKYSKYRRDRSEYRRKWETLNRERVRARTKAWRAANPDKIREYHRRFVEKRRFEQVTKLDKTNTSPIETGEIRRFSRTVLITTSSDAERADRPHPTITTVGRS